MNKKGNVFFMFAMKLLKIFFSFRTQIITNANYAIEYKIKMKIIEAIKEEFLDE